jgi:hypothetical protein
MSLEANQAEIAAAQRRARWWNTWFWLFVLLIPLGVVCPCLISAVAYRVAGDEWSAPIALSALLWPIVGVAGALLVRGVRKRSRRTLALARLADSFGLRFTYQPPAESYAFLRTVSGMAEPHTQSAENFCEGTSGQFALMALDYHYAYLWGSVTEYADQTLIVFPAGFEALPALAVFPISVMGRLENLLLGKGGAIPFPHEPQFNAQFAVAGEDAARVAACLSRPLIELLLADRLLSLIVEQGRLLVFRRLTIVPAEQYQAFLAQAYRVAELLGGRPQS